MRTQMNDVTMHCNVPEDQGRAYTKEVISPTQLMQALADSSVAIIFVNASIALDAAAVNGTIVIDNRNVSIVGGVLCCS